MYAMCCQACIIGMHIAYMQCIRECWLHRSYEVYRLAVHLSTLPALANGGQAALDCLNSMSVNAAGAWLMLHDEMHVKVSVCFEDMYVGCQEAPPGSHLFVRSLSARVRVHAGYALVPRMLDRRNIYERTMHT